MTQLKEEIAEVEAATAEFYRALQAILSGDVSLMERVWSHNDTVTYLGPQGGILLGWKQVLEAWKEQANLKLGGHVEPKSIQIQHNGEIVIVQNYETGTNYVEGKTESVSIRATSIFHKENGQWKMISHHTDLLPYLH